MQSKRLHYELVSKGLTELNKINDKASHPFKTAWLATVAAKSAFPSLRTVVVRSFKGSNTLEIYTDTRSQKWFHLKEKPKAELGFYEPNLKLQIRAKATIQLVEGNEEAQQVFVKLSLDQQRNYSTKNAPGTYLTSDVAYSAKAHFGIIKAELFELDFLQLLPKNESLRARATLNKANSIFDIIEGLVP